MSGDIFTEILKTLDQDGAMSQSTRDKLMLRGMILLFEKIDTMNTEITELKKIIPLYKILIAIGSVLITLVAGLLWEIFTGKIQLVF